MRIAIVAHGLAKGGAERVASLLANHFYGIGHTVLFVAVYSPEKGYALENGVEYVYIEGNRTNKITRAISRANKLDRVIHRNKVDLVISFLKTELLYYSFHGSVPIIYSLRNDPANSCNTKIKKLLCTMAYRRAAKIVFQTPGARAFFDQKIQQKGVIIANPLTRNLPYWKGECCTKKVITACRLMKQKNLPMLIEGFTRFHKKHPEYTLEIYGDGVMRAELEEQMRRLHMEESIRLPGFANNIHEIMACSGIFALTSDYEGLSNSMLEALAIGIPTVCTDCPPGGAAMYIRDGENGMLVPVGDAQALADKLCQMAENPALCARMSANAQKIREELDVDKVLKQWEEVLCV